MMTVVANYARRTSNRVARWNASVAIDGVDAEDDNSLTLADESRGPADALLDAEDTEEVIDALARIKHDERVALLLLGVGHSYVEIQALTGWSRTKVRRCVYEGRRAVRAQLRERGGKR
jgi:DNA-directed RNA polymerase specialized sigma24 family protein